ncbi:hypothetical protein ABFA07_007183 [Porites harrisoni]
MNRRMLVIFLVLCLALSLIPESEAWRRRRAGLGLHKRRHFHPQSETAKVVSEKNKLEDSVESKDREGLDHDLEDEMWS